MDTTSRKLHRGKRRSRKGIRTVLLTLGCLAAPTGLSMALWGLSDQAALPLRFGLLNIGGSTVCFLAHFLLRKRPEPAPRQTREAIPVTANDTSRAGMALLVSLVMLALLSGMALHSLVTAGTDLRFARERHTACLLRTAGTDATLTLLRETPRLSPDTLAHLDRTQTAGPGIETLTSMREVDRTALPPPFLLQNTPLFGRFFTVTTRITRDTTAREIRALACLLPTGELRLLSWTEPL